jgi:hypothetical protein
MKRPSLVAVSRDVKQKQETARQIIVYVTLTAPSPNPIVAKNPEIALPKMIVGETVSKPKAA